MKYKFNRLYAALMFIILMAVSSVQTKAQTQIINTGGAISNQPYPFIPTQSLTSCGWNSLEWGFLTIDTTLNKGVFVEFYFPTDWLDINTLQVYTVKLSDFTEIPNAWNVPVITPVSATYSKVRLNLKTNIDIQATYDGDNGFGVGFIAKAIKAGPQLWNQDFTFGDVGGTSTTTGYGNAHYPVTVGTCVIASNDTYSVPAGTATASVLTNDNYRGGGAGTATPSNVNVTGVTVPTGFTLNANGTISVGAAVVPGTYTVTYQICDSMVSTADQVCSTATATITVKAPCTNGNNYVNLNSLYTGTLPTGVVLEWWTSADRLSPGVKVTDPTHVTASGRYYVFFYDTVNSCYNTNLSTSYVDVTILPPCNTACYKPGIADAGNTYPSKHGITSLGRAGATDADNWPMVRQSAWTVLEAKTKGFVVNRVKFNASNQPVADDGATLVITNPVEGMMVYDKTNNCLKVYTSTDGGSTFSWQCMSTQACPD